MPFTVVAGSGSLLYVSTSQNVSDEKKQNIPPAGCNTFYIAKTQGYPGW